MVSSLFVFVDEWDVGAPIGDVFRAVSDARTYPVWWKAVYLNVEADGPPKVGGVARMLFKGRLPYRLRIVTTMIRLEPPREFEIAVNGDLAGRGMWTLAPTATGTHVRFDWRVNIERPWMRLLAPILGPAFRWNHAWAIKRAKAGLEPYALKLAGQFPKHVGPFISAP